MGSMFSRQFIPTRLHKTIFFIVQRLGLVQAIELAKLLYLLDWTSYEERGFRFTNAQYYRQKMGPLAYKLNEIVNEMNDHELTVEDFKAMGREHKIGPNPRFVNDFDKDDIEFIERFLASFGQLGSSKLKSLSYETPPMVNILEEEKKRGVMLKGKPLDFENYLSNQPLGRFARLVKDLDFSVKGTPEMQAEEDLRIISEFTTLRQRAAERN